MRSIRQVYVNSNWLEASTCVYSPMSESLRSLWHVWSSLNAKCHRLANGAKSIQHRPAFFLRHQTPQNEQLPNDKKKKHKYISRLQLFARKREHNVLGKSRINIPKTTPELPQFFFSFTSQRTILAQKIAERETSRRHGKKKNGGHSLTSLCTQLLH